MPGAPTATAPAVPPQTDSVKNSARGRVPGSSAPGVSDNRKAALSQMREVGQGMKDGIVTNTSPVAPKSPQSAAPASTAKPATTTQTPSTSPTPPEADPAKTKALAEAKRTLIRSGIYDVEDLTALSDDAILKYAARREPLQKEADRVFSEHRRLATQPRQENGQFANKDQPPTAEKPADGAAPAPVIDALPADIAAELKAAEAKMGPDAAKLMGSLMSKVIGLVGQRSATSEMLGREMVANVGQQLLGELYPDKVADMEGFKEVLTEDLPALLATGRYQEGQLRKAVTDALYMKYGAPNTVRNAQREALSRQTAAVNGKVDAGAYNGTPANGNPPSKREQLKSIGELMAKHPGKSVDELRRMIST